MPENPSRPPQLHWLTALRYPATIWVIMKHSLHNFGDPNAIPDSMRRDFMERGFLGVPFFFILSGFILAYNYPVIASKRDYLSARVGRILPVYYLSLLFSLPMLFKVISENGLGFALPRALTFLTLTQAWVPNWTSIWNFPAWTLSCEAFFYVSLILLLPLLQSFIMGSPKKALAIIAACFVAGEIAPMWFHLKFGDPAMNDLDLPGNEAMLHASNIVKIFILFHCTEFIAGVALCVGMRSYLPALAKYSGWMILVGIAQILTSLFLPPIFSQGTWCLPGFVLVVLGAAALPFPDLKTASPAVRYFLPKGVLLGNISYSVYLFHVPFIFYLGFINRHVHPIFPNGERGVWSLYVADVVITTLVGSIIYHFYEQPARKWVTEWSKRHWGKESSSVVKIPIATHDSA